MDMVRGVFFTNARGITVKQSLSPANAGTTHHRARRARRCQACCSDISGRRLPASLQRPDPTATRAQCQSGAPSRPPPGPLQAPASPLHGTTAPLRCYHTPLCSLQPAACNLAAGRPPGRSCPLNPPSTAQVDRTSLSEDSSTRIPETPYLGRPVPAPSLTQSSASDRPFCLVSPRLIVVDQLPPPRSLPHHSPSPSRFCFCLCLCLCFCFCLSAFSSWLSGFLLLLLLHPPFTPTSRTGPIAFAFAFAPFSTDFDRNLPLDFSHRPRASPRRNRKSPHCTRSARPLATQPATDERGTHSGLDPPRRPDLTAACSALLHVSWRSGLLLATSPALESAYSRCSISRLAPVLGSGWLSALGCNISSRSGVGCIASPSSASAGGARLPWAPPCSQNSPSPLLCPLRLCLALSAVHTSQPSLLG